MADCDNPVYLPASYNGVFFDCLIAGSEHGRRGVTGEFPFGEQTASQDMGIKLRKYSIKGRFQFDCIIQTAALIEAIETIGPGTLVHPTRGVLQVSCASLKITDDIVQGRNETNFDADFVDAGSFNVGFGASGLPIIAAIAPIIQIVADAFQLNYGIKSIPFFQKGFVQDTAQSALSTIATSFANVIPSISNPIDTWQTLYNVQSNAANRSITASAPTLITAIQYGYSSIDVYGRDVDTKYNTVKDLANTFAKSATMTGIAGDSQEALFSALRIMCAAYMLRSATQIISVTLEDALKKLDEIASIIAQEKSNALVTDNNDLYIALTNFEAMALQTLTNYAYNLPPIIIYPYDGGIPSLVAAHEIYGDVNQAVQLEQRNPNNWPFALGPQIHALGVNP